MITNANDRLAPYRPAALFGAVGSIQLLSAFQVAGGLTVAGADKAQGVAIVSRMTSISPEGFTLPSNRSELDLAGWLDWLASSAVDQERMEWFEPLAWAVPAAADRHWF